MADSNGNQERGAWFAILDDLGVIRLSGADAAQLLQGQLSNDVTRLAAPAAAQLTSLSQARGRVLATAVLARHDDAYLLILPAAMAEIVAARLRMFVLRAKVEVDTGPGLQVVGVAGAETVARVAPALGDTPFDAVATPDGVLAIRYPAGGAPRALLLLPAGAPPIAPAGTAPGRMADWWLADVHAGLPSVLPAAAEQHVAQMLNLDVLGAISFEKGCYTGQEVIARTHYRGRTKRRLQRYACEAVAGASRAPAAGDEIVIAGAGDDGARVGSVVLAVAGAAAGELLAVVQLDALAAAPAAALAIPGVARLSPLPLPYALPD